MGAVYAAHHRSPPSRAVARAREGGLAIAAIALALVRTAGAAGADAAPIFASGFESPHVSRIDLESLVPPDGFALSSGLGVGIGLDFTSPQDPLPTPLRLSVDGVDFSAGLETGDSHIQNTHVGKLAPGLHRVMAQVGADTATWSFITLPAPQIDPIQPDAVTLPAGSQPSIMAHFSDANSSLDAARVGMEFNDDNVTAQAQITLSDAHSGTITFVPPTALQPGYYRVTVGVTNAIGATQQAAAYFNVDTPVTYRLDFLTPASGATVTEPVLESRVMAGASKAKVADVAINGEAAWASAYAADGNTYSARVRLSPGSNILEAVARFDDGQTRRARTSVVYTVAPTVSPSRVNSRRQQDQRGPIGVHFPFNRFSPEAATERARTGETDVRMRLAVLTEFRSATAAPIEGHGGQGCVKRLDPTTACAGNGRP